jgi:hypothetical protein
MRINAPGALLSWSLFVIAPQSSHSHAIHALASIKVFYFYFCLRKNGLRVGQRCAHHDRAPSGGAGPCSPCGPQGPVFTFF